MAALAELIPYAIAIVCLALAAIITVIVFSLFKWLIDLLNTIPTVNIGTGWLNTTEQSVTHALGVAFGWVNKEVGASFHQLARFTDWLWEELRGHGILLLEIATGIYPIVVAVHALTNLVHHLTATSKTGDARVKTLEKKYEGIDKEIRALKKEYHGIDQINVGKRLGELEREAANIAHVQLPAAIAAQRQADSAISNLYEWAKGKASIVGVGTFSLAVSVALDALGLAALKCTNFKNLLGRFGCGLGTLLNDLLGLAIAGIALEGVCEFLPEIEAAFGAIAGPMVHVLNEVPLGACETVPDGWAALSVAHGPLPPPQTLGRLAA